jgi:hypothetical protein
MGDEAHAGDAETEPMLTRDEVHEELREEAVEEAIAAAEAMDVDEEAVAAAEEAEPVAH